MSMSKYMHPRNIYKNPPNFKKLSIEFPEFRKHVKQELTGKVSINFHDINALRALTCTLLKKDFNLDIELPLDKLVPTVPLRLNYILWVEDLMEIAGKNINIRGIDIGTGGSCIYPLLAARKYDWEMLATEIDDESLKYAIENVVNNGLDHLINVMKPIGDTLLIEAIEFDVYDFCMCNPPFFGSHQETLFEFKSRKQTRPRPHNAFCASKGEVIVNGGEVEFIKKLIQESKELKQKIRIYTSMVGHKTSLLPLKKLLRESGAISFKQTEFCQGNTTRWGLAWTYCDIDLRKVPQTTLAASRKDKLNKPVEYILPKTEKDYNVEDIAERLIQLLNKLEIDFKEMKHTKNVMAYNIIAHKNTWSHQRRKRREQQRLTSGHNNSNSSEEGTSIMDSSERPNTPSIENAIELISEMKVISPGTAKRELEDDEGYYSLKKIRLVDEEDEGCISKSYLEATVVIRKDTKGLHFELIWIDGSANKDVLQQILQHVKNNMKLI